MPFAERSSLTQHAQYSAGDIDGAIASYTRAIRNAPTLAVAYLNRAGAYLYKPNFQAAIADANAALELKVPQVDDGYNIRATAQAGLDDFDAAIADCNRALKFNTRNALAYNNRASNKLRKRDYAGALADGNKSVSLDPNLALAYYNRGFARTNLGAPGGALVDWEKAVAMQASFAAELNPKVAQLRALGFQAKQPAQAGSSATTSQPQWSDLTNAPQKLVGSWKGGRHTTRYLADGSFYTDPDLVPNPPRGHAAESDHGFKSQRRSGERRSGRNPIAAPADFRWAVLSQRWRELLTHLPKIISR